MSKPTYAMNRAYQLRHMAAGLCMFCPQPVAAGSKTRCEKHLAAGREYKRRAAERRKAQV